MLSRDEALKQRRKWTEKYWACASGCAEERKADRELAKLNKIIEFWDMTPTPQLCIVAQRLADEDTND